jgi:hypothetical protein
MPKTAPNQVSITADENVDTRGRGKQISIESSEFKSAVER